MKKMNWFELWMKDKESTCNTMKRNMQADLEAGHDPNGAYITTQRNMIADYKRDIVERVEFFVNLPNQDAVNRWCYDDMKRRGVI